MRSFNGLAQFAKFIEAQALTSNSILNASVGVMAHTLHQKVHDVFGDLDKLQPLKPATIAKKERKGYDQPEAPLIATGALRDSFEVVHVGDTAGVGTSDMKMVYHEYGTAHLPPRPVLRIAVSEATEECFDVFKGAATVVLGEGTKLPKS